MSIDRSEASIVRRLSSAPVSLAATAFQTGLWLRAWYATIGRSVGEPMLIEIRDRRDGSLAAMLPLVRRTDGRLRVIEFADDGVSDSNNPVLGPAAPTTPAGAAAFWGALRDALRDADLVRFTKMSPEIEGRTNPLTLLPSAQRSPLSSYVVALDSGIDGHLAGLKGVRRKQLRRKWHAFSTQADAAFRRVEPDDALRVLAVLERQQGDRLRKQGQPYRLDQPDFSAFYQHITAEGIGDGSVVMTALTSGDEIVAALLGVTRGDTFVVLRVCTGAERWSKLSPGILVMSQTMAMVRAEGYRLFDLSVGNYPYKRRLGARSRPLFDLTSALTPLGVPLLVYDRAKHFVQGQPALHNLARRIAAFGHRPYRD